MVDFFYHMAQNTTIDISMFAGGVIFMTTNFNLTELLTKENLSTKEKLVREGIRLFSQYGFEATTTRMLADAVGANNASVYFHFGNKETLYFEVLNTVAAYMNEKYQPLRYEIDVRRANGSLSSSEAWIFIEKYVDLYISIIKDPINNAVLYLLIHEQINPVNEQRPITGVACKQGEQILTQLLMDYWQNVDANTAAITSRLATGALISLAEHPSFMRLTLGLEPYAELSDTIWHTIRTYTLNSLKVYPILDS